MDMLLDAALRTFRNLGEESRVLIARMTEYIEPLHVAVFVIGIWMLVKITGPGIRKS